MQRLIITDKQQEESHWWQLFCNGNKTALSFFYKKYYNLLYNYGLKLLDNPLQIQDFIQDIFYKLCKSNPKEINNPKVYLLKAMRNEVYDYYTSFKETISIEEIPFAVPEEAHVFDAFFNKDDEEVEQWKSVLEAIKALPDQQKQVLYLYYIKELSHKEIGEILGINPQSSMNTLAKSIKKLRAALGGHSDSLLLFFIVKSLLWLH